MPIEIEWDDPDKTIIYTRVTGAWTWEEMHQISEKSILMRQSVTHEVGSIVDFSAAKCLPDGAIAPAKKIINRQESYSGTTVFVGVDFVSASLWNVLMSVYSFFIRHQNFQFAKSLPEARARLQTRNSVMAMNSVRMDV
jgi:hypothetical protein